MSNRDGFVEPPPVQVLSRQRVAENQVFTLHFDHVRGNGGVEVRRFLNVIPKDKTPDGITGVSVLPVRRQAVNRPERIGLIRLWRHPLGCYGWEAPKGFVDQGETPAQGAIRELHEETGLICPPDHLVSLGEAAPEPGVIQARIRLFAASLPDDAMAHGEPEQELGHHRFQWFDPCGINRILTENSIVDAVTLALILMWRHHSV